AARGLPDAPRVHYNLALLQAYLGQDRQAEVSLRRAVALEPDNMAYLELLAQHYLKQGAWAEAGKLADQMITRHPGDSRGVALKNAVQRNSPGSK
ncbi:MAG: hypothetical protein HZB24_12385, partial [Desulfobacterales bacterium]|nr:hypothetical protein [Desulfobacterales bacterium]